MSQVDVYPDHTGQYLQVRWQRGTVRDNGQNGTQVEELLRVAFDRLAYLQSRLGCLENTNALAAIINAIDQLEKRKAVRMRQGVEGTEQAHESR